VAGDLCRRGPTGCSSTANEIPCFRRSTGADRALRAADVVISFLLGSPHLRGKAGSNPGRDQLADLPASSLGHLPRSQRASYGAYMQAHMAISWGRRKTTPGGLDAWAPGRLRPRQMIPAYAEPRILFHQQRLCRLPGHRGHPGLRHAGTGPHPYRQPLYLAPGLMPVNPGRPRGLDRPIRAGPAKPGKTKNMGRWFPMSFRRIWIGCSPHILSRLSA